MCGRDWRERYRNPHSQKSRGLDRSSFQNSFRALAVKGSIPSPLESFPFASRSSTLPALAGSSITTTAALPLATKVGFTTISVRSSKLNVTVFTDGSSIPHQIRRPPESGRILPRWLFSYSSSEHGSNSQKEFPGWRGSTRIVIAQPVESKRIGWRGVTAKAVQSLPLPTSPDRP